eukprot:jgi/Tetstr1/430087/TSEL_001948.t1
MRPRQEAEEAVVEATDRAEGFVEASEAALDATRPAATCGTCRLARRHVDPEHYEQWREAATCTIITMHDDLSAGCPLPDHRAVARVEFRHVRDAFHDATRAAVCEASEKARSVGVQGGMMFIHKVGFLRLRKIRAE